MLAHNKTLAAQLYQEFKRLFPENAVEYFVSYYDYYQPEAYVPQSDTVHRKRGDGQRRDRSHAARRDAGVVRTPRRDDRRQCLLHLRHLGSPEAYHGMMLLLERGAASTDRDAVLRKLVEIQYERVHTDLRRGAFRVRGDTVEIWPSYLEEGIRLEFWGDEIESLSLLRSDPRQDDRTDGAAPRLSQFALCDPARPADPRNRIDPRRTEPAAGRVGRRHDKLLEAQRLHQRTQFRPRDDDGSRLLPRDRELHAAPDQRGPRVSPHRP